MSKDQKGLEERARQRGMTREVMKAKVGKLLELLEEQDVDPDEIGAINRVNIWQQGYKDAAGDGQVQTLVGLQFDPSWKTGPQWPVVEPGKPHIVKMAKTTPRVGRKGWESAVILPDMQGGFYRTPDGELIATHDEQALDIAMQVVRQVQPDQIVMHGDNFDFPEMSTKYRLSPAFQQTTQATVNWGTELGFQLRANAPSAAIHWLAGNHEERLGNYILDNARAAFALKRGRSTPDEWPVMTVPFLTRMDEWGGDFLSGYPANSYWLNERLQIIHGNKVRSNGPTAHLYLDDARHSTLFGHIHRREWVERTRIAHDGPRTILAASAGCLCRTDGAVPSVKQGIDLQGVPIENHEDWQQGLFVVNYQPGDGMFNIEVVPIFFGRGLYRDQEFESSV